ncbi:glycosyltransferase family 2 protein (plasmid) [Pedobacter sp. BS3]|uniref:glycosyltransferase family 2 protein n=1 Tax=Pedobacter sp. BS3 TaxID=2567937 RepID=UPI0011EF3359|nr:glycosyltransferase family A protein [Pedobacter sp. BS3]TZF86206.1 glycosyltransferase family 2 protein [Pedobacter sp. BS3]
MEKNKSVIKNELISVCMPAYNAEKYIREAINSILVQSYTNLELIIVNDGSTDQTLSVVKQFSDPRIKIINRENKGQCAAANLAYQHATGEYIKFMDADDIISRDFIKNQYELINGHPTWIASAQWGRFYHNDLSTFTLNPERVWKDMKPIDWLVESLQDGPNMMQCALWLIPRNILDRTGLWNEELSLINDFEFFIRVLLTAEQIKFSDKATLFYRSGMQHSLSRQKSKKALLSGYLSTKLGCASILSFENSARTREICANLYQLWHYECYPQLPIESLELKLLADNIGGSNLKFVSAGYTRVLATLLGWKRTKYIKYLLGF